MYYGRPVLHCLGQHWRGTNVIGLCYFVSRYNLPGSTNSNTHQSSFLSGSTTSTFEQRYFLPGSTTSTSEQSCFLNLLISFSALGLNPTEVQNSSVSPDLSAIQRAQRSTIGSPRLSVLPCPTQARLEIQIIQVSIEYTERTTADKKKRDFKRNWKEHK